METTNTCDLSKKECAACKSDVAALKGDAILGLLGQLGEGWAVYEEHHLERTFKFKNFRDGLDFTNELGELAEAHNHHPDIGLSWGKVVVRLCTHKIDGLSESDFVMAAKIDALGKSL